MSWLAFVIVLLTVVLILDCLFLVLLVLVQLPKKDAGVGQAFGGGATDALFGAGSGNALTKMTKYSAVVFFVLTLSLSILNAEQQKAKRSNLERNLQAVGKQAEFAPAPTPATANPATNAAKVAVPLVSPADTSSKQTTTPPPPANAPANPPPPTAPAAPPEKTK